MGKYFRQKARGHPLKIIQLSPVPLTFRMELIGQPGRKFRWV